MNDCIFCKIVKKEINAFIIDENESSIAFLDINPINKAHVLVVPKQHYDNLSMCDDHYLASTIKLVKQVANKLISIKELGIKGFNYLSNEQKIAGQVINHLHFHIIPRYEDDQINFTNGQKSINVEELYEKLFNHK